MTKILRQIKKTLKNKRAVNLSLWTLLYLHEIGLFLLYFHGHTHTLDYASRQTADAYI